MSHEAWRDTLASAASRDIFAWVAPLCHIVLSEGRSRWLIADMATTFVLALLSLYFSNAFAQNNFTVITPRAGDTVSLGDTALGDIQVPIAWTVAEAIADRPVIISLVQGNNVSSLSQVALVNCAYNAGPIYGPSH